MACAQGAPCQQSASAGADDPWFRPSPHNPARASPGSRRGTADGQCIDQHRGLTDTGGNALPTLAADADTFVERHVVADAEDAGQDRRPIADQRRTLDRRAEFAVVDLVSFGAAEHEFAANDIDLAST